MTLGLLSGVVGAVVLRIREPAERRIAPTSPDGAESYHSHVMMELMRLAEQSESGPVVIDSNYVEAQVDKPKLEHHQDQTEQEQGNERNDDSQDESS